MCGAVWCCVGWRWVNNKPARPRFGARYFSIWLILLPARWPASKQNHSCCGTGLSNRIRALEQTRPQEKRQRNIRWVQDAGRDSAVSPCSRCGGGQGRGQGTRGVYPASTRSTAAGRIIPQQDGERQRGQAEGLPACQSASLCAWCCHQGSLAIPRNCTGGLSGDPIAIQGAGGLAGRAGGEGDGRVGKREAWQAEVRALLG